jgi:acyl-CoA synthetase (AMP-forming)/AMP-acid ligase II/aryl carrier-like protein
VTPAELAEFAGQRQLTGMWLTAGLFRVIADHRPDAFTGLRQVLTGGDVVPPEQVRQVLRRCPGLEVTNGYGPTENTTFTTVHSVRDPAEVGSSLPIGRPVPGTSVLVLDRNGRLVPPGGIGELYGGGAGLALGYLGLPADVAGASFGPLSPETGERLYRTGDLVRWDQAGLLQFLGRRDRQVKIRGFRIELDAIAAVLRAHPGVRDAVAAATSSGTSDRRLLAGIVADDTPGLLSGLRRRASDQLPAYAVPSLWVIVPALPITRNGKLDVTRLEQLALHGHPPAAPAAPPAAVPAPASGQDGPGSLEAAISGIWRQVLGVDAVPPDVRFFDLGGDSLRLMRLHAQLTRLAPDARIDIGDLYRHPTIRALARHLSDQQNGGR